MNAIAFRINLAKTTLPVGNSIIIDRRGLPVDISGERWHLNEPTAKFILDWDMLSLTSIGVRTAFRRHFEWLIINQAPMSVHNAFRALRHWINTPAFQKADSVGGIIPYLAFSEARAGLGPKAQWQLHYARKLYRWCVSQGHPNFSADVVNRLDDVVIGGNTKGQAVRSLDPEKGPLNAQEVAVITTALRAVRLENSMPLHHQAILWLGLSCGSNAGQFACLREEDVTHEKIDGVTVAWIIKIPRHKKGHTHHRTAFRERRIDGTIGRILDDLIERNRVDYPIKPDDFAARPLFRAAKPSFEQGHPLAEWTWHCTRGQIQNVIRQGIELLKVKSRTGNPLKISSRRMRYTLGSRVVNNGGSACAVADILDHSDLQNVPVYFEIHSNIVDHIDQAMALALAPHAQALTKIVEREEDAERGEKKGSRCYFGDRERDISEPVGTCGNHSFCNITAAPLACYTCPKFQPWMDGPHDLVLDTLLRDRESRIELRLDPKMVSIHDHIITEVANVIVRVAAKRADRAQND